jgi:hypothetical protein
VSSLQVGSVRAAVVVLDAPCVVDRGRTLEQVATLTAAATTKMQSLSLSQRPLCPGVLVVSILGAVIGLRSPEGSPSPEKGIPAVEDAGGARRLLLQ